jgi:hypothetical protein
MAFVRGSDAEDGLHLMQNTVSWLTPGAVLLSATKSPVLGRLAPFPRLRRKTGLCYTAGAHSPFEAYINVR